MFPLLFINFSAWAALREENVEFRAGNIAMKGYLAWDDAKGEKQQVAWMKRTAIQD